MADTNNYKTVLTKGSKNLYALSAEIKSKSASVAQNEGPNYDSIKTNEDSLTQYATKIKGKINTSSVQKIVSQIGSIKQKSITLFGKHTSSEIERLRPEVLKAWSQYGAICDREGFYQHSGECWSDSLQMLYLFADGFKEIVQEQMVKMNCDNVIPTNLIKKLRQFLESIKDNSDEKEKIEQILSRSDFDTYQRTLIVTYLKSTQHRFFRHYLIETKRRRVEQECIKDPRHQTNVYSQLIDIGKLYRNKGADARSSAGIKVTSLNTIAYRATLLDEGSGPGGNDSDQLYIHMIYNNIFFGGNLSIINVPQLLPKTAPEFDPNLSKYKSSIKSSTDDKITGVAIGTSQHALLFYMCGNQEMFYEDNSGIIKFPWKTYLKNIDGNLLPRFYLGANLSLKSKNVEYECSYYPFIAIDGKLITYIEDTLEVIIGNYEQPDKILQDDISAEEYSKIYLPKKIETIEKTVSRLGGEYKIEITEKSWNRSLSHFSIIIIPNIQKSSVKDNGNSKPMRLEFDKELKQALDSNNRTELVNMLIDSSKSKFIYIMNAIFIKSVDDNNFKLIEYCITEFSNRILQIGDAPFKETICTVVNNSNDENIKNIFKTYCNKPPAGGATKRSSKKRGRRTRKNRN